MNATSHHARSSSLQIAIVARQYWPSVGDASLRLAQTAANLRDLGVRTTLLTPRWHSSWPKRVSVEEIDVQRLEFPPTNPLRQSQYRRCLSDWLDKHADTLSCLYCDEASLDALTVIKHHKVVQREFQSSFDMIPWIHPFLLTLMKIANHRSLSLMHVHKLRPSWFHDLQCNSICCVLEFPQDFFRSVQIGLFDRLIGRQSSSRRLGGR